MYHLTPETDVALRVLETLRGPRAVLLEGPPGTGKTAFPEFISARWGAEYLYYLCHHWTSDEELFIGVHVGRVAAGVSRPEDAYEYGVLAKAALASQRGPVVLCIDEIDKAPQRTEALLLDFLQHGRIVLPDGQWIRADVQNLTVVLTSNSVRPLMEATLRRCFRVTMGFLPPHVEAQVLREKTGAKAGVARLVVAMMNTIRSRGATKPSLQEGLRLLETMTAAESTKDVELLLRGWLCKEPEDWAALAGEYKNPAAALWGEWRR